MMFSVLKQPPLPQQSLEKSNKIKVVYKKREEDDVCCRGHILNHLSE